MAAIVGTFSDRGRYVAGSLFFKAITRRLNLEGFDVESVEREMSDYGKFEYAIKLRGGKIKKFGIEFGVMCDPPDLIDLIKEKLLEDLPYVDRMARKIYGKAR